ncbi:integral membrane protein MviN [Methylocella silvestris BL2]|uniref:Probable lipid II flippase MurJ n=1 Tax=Methylocella silvestris (strain DSM 15510 / CIP 108128 / LMG 27833 / NCIMB 13906 / BL2) TaxID=395965 RepID=B8EQS7_METSB|nr:murein biosynthesis integral membrane protein MurJ [Methylocella silvestris]ACK49348.1 integral membrane protein MviN [Methylocella silvestris BL2]
MYKSLLSVGGFTLMSRAAGFLRDIVLGAVLGAGLLADAFVVAQRLPNHFRAIFGEGAWNAAFVPTYSQVLQGEGLDGARRFSGQIFVGLLVCQLVLLALALLFTPAFVDLLAPGFREDPEKFDLTVTLTRITFPYLLFVTLVTLQSGALNAHGLFAAAAFAPVLMNLSMIAFLGVAYLFPDAGVAASWGLTISGVLQLTLTSVAAWRAGILERFAWPRMTANVKRFLTTLGPAVIGSAGVQIALFTDTIIGSMLPTGGPSSIYYADRIYQLPLGVIGIAAGTVLLPQMSRLLAAGRPAGALHAQNRTMAISLVLTAPFFVAFIMIPDFIMKGIFLRGAFTLEAAYASADVLSAYGFGLIAIVLLRSAVASFQAHGDTKTPMLISLAAVAVNIGLKLILFEPWGAAGLATATAVGAWVNLLLLAFFAIRRGSMKPDLILWKTAACVSTASCALSFFALLAAAPIERIGAKIGHFANETELLLLGFGGALIYAAVLLAGLHIAGVKLRRSSPPEDKIFESA